MKIWRIDIIIANASSYFILNILKMFKRSKAKNLNLESKFKCKFFYEILINILNLNTVVFHCISKYMNQWKLRNKIIKISWKC